MSSGGWYDTLSVDRGKGLSLTLTLAKDGRSLDLLYKAPNDSSDLHATLSRPAEGR